MKRTFIKYTLLLSSLFQIACLNNDNWYLLKKESFNLSFPGKPIEEIKVTNSQYGELKIIGNIYQVPDQLKDENLLYGIAETKYPDNSLNIRTAAQIDSFLLEAVNGATRKVGKRIIPIKAITKDNFPGREIKIKHDKYPYIITMDIYLANNHMYALQTISEISKKNNESIDKFMKSFTMKSSNQ